MIKLFKPEDFNFPETMSAAYLPDRAASLANEILQREVEKWPVVFIHESTNGGWTAATKEKYNEDTHTARLAFIEEIKKECTKHAPDLQKMFQDYGLQNSKCQYCGVKLVAEWKEK